MNEEFWKVIFLAAVQGVAEFLPISSSGHLMVLGKWLNFDPESNLQLNVVLHAGTLLAIVVYYFRTLMNLLLNAKRRRVILLVIAGTIPTGLIGIAIKKSGLEETLFATTLWVPVVGFCITAGLLFFALNDRRMAKAEEAGDLVPLERMPLWKALVVGVVQGLAITPGVSRSGSTIAAALKTGCSKKDAAEFSFLLAIPAIGGAALLEGLDAVKSATVPQGAELIQLLAGFGVSFVVGFFALWALIEMLRKGKLVYFAWYLLFAAATVSVVQLLR